MEHVFFYAFILVFPNLNVLFQVYGWQQVFGVVLGFIRKSSEFVR